MHGESLFNDHTRYYCNSFPYLLAHIQFLFFFPRLSFSNGLCHLGIIAEKSVVMERATDRFLSFLSRPYRRDACRSDRFTLQSKVSFKLKHFIIDNIYFHKSEARDIISFVLLTVNQELHNSPKSRPFSLLTLFYLVHPSQ